jgi:hypothetical protein
MVDQEVGCGHFLLQDNPHSYLLEEYTGMVQHYFLEILYLSLEEILYRLLQARRRKDNRLRRQIWTTTSSISRLGTGWQSTMLMQQLLPLQGLLCQLLVEALVLVSDLVWDYSGWCLQDGLHGGTGGDTGQVIDNEVSIQTWARGNKASTPVSWLDHMDPSMSRVVTLEEQARAKAKKKCNSRPHLFGDDRDREKAGHGWMGVSPLVSTL